MPNGKSKRSKAPVTGRNNVKGKGPAITANPTKSARTATTSQVASTAPGRQVRSVTFGSTREPSTRTKAPIANIPVSAIPAATNPGDDNEEDDKEDEEEDEEEDKEDGEDDDEDDGDYDELNNQGRATSDLVGFGQPLDSYGDRRVPTSDQRFTPGHAGYTAPGNDTYTADQTLSPSFAGSTTQTAMAYPHLSRPLQGGSRRLVNDDDLPASSPIVSSIERAAKRRRLEGEDADHSVEDPNRDILNIRQATAHRALPDVRLLNEAARRLATPARPTAGTLATRIQGRAITNPVTLENVRRRRGDEGRVVPPYQLGAYTPFTKSFLREGKNYYKSQVITQNAFPSGELRMDQGKAAWEHAIRAKPEAYAHASLKTFTPHVLRLFGDTAWAFRGAVKTETKRIVLSEYGLTPPNTLGANTAGPAGPMAFTQARVKYLLEDNRFLYGLFHDRSDIPFTHMALCMIIERTVFVGLGPDMRHVLSPMPASLVALAAAAVVNGLHEWSDGYHKKKAFKEEVYGPVYRYFLKKLFEFEQERPNRFKMLMSSYFTYCTVSTQPEPEEDADGSDNDDWAVCGSASEDDELILYD